MLCMQDLLSEAKVSDTFISLCYHNKPKNEMTNYFVATAWQVGDGRRGKTAHIDLKGQEKKCCRVRLLCRMEDNVPTF